MAGCTLSAAYHGCMNSERSGKGQVRDDYYTAGCDRKNVGLKVGNWFSSLLFLIITKALFSLLTKWQYLC